MIEHPLAMIDSDDTSNDDDHGRNSLIGSISSSTSPMQAQSTRLLTTLRDTSPSSQTSLSSIDRRSSPIVELDSQTISLANIIRSKCQAKRMAPKAPNLSLNQTSSSTTTNLNNEFLIPVEMVRWFFKTEKEKHHHEQANTVQSAITAAAVVSGTSTLSATNDSVKSSNGSLDIPTDSNNNTSMIGNKITVSKKWEMFKKWDSFNLETEYRKMISSRKNSRSITKEEFVVQVLDNMYEVNLDTRKCYQIYQKTGRKMKVQRCLWYRDTNEPFDEHVGEEIEKRHVELFRDTLTYQMASPTGSEVSATFTLAGASDDQFESSSIESNSSTTTTNKTSKNSKNESSKGQIEPISTLQFEDGVILWFSESEVYMEKAKSNVLLDKMTDLLKSKSKLSSGIKIKRGYFDKKESGGVSSDTADDKPREITHLVFVVHGIAQKLYENSIVKSCEDLRQECEKQKKELLSNYAHQRHVFIPVDWRTSLTLDDGVIESITPKSIQTIRDKLNASLLDIMYYTSPLFKTEIVTSLASEANRLYNLFCQKNPTFKEKHNKVSIVAHSLGTVIIYDILTSNDFRNLLNSNGQESSQDKVIFDHYASTDNQKLLQEYTNCKQRMQEIEKILISGTNRSVSFDFKTENFFLLGSPLAVFLTLRGLRPGGSGSQDHILPKQICSHLFNIFHPWDPVAYRLEPLVLKHYTSKTPMEIQRASDVAKKGFQKDVNEKRQALDFDLKIALSKPTSALKRRETKDSHSAELSQIKDENGINNVRHSLQLAATSSNLPLSIDKVELDEAIDFQLQESNFELMAAYKAHSCYWKSSDVALFIMQQLCQNDERKSNGTNKNLTSKI